MTDAFRGVGEIVVLPQPYLDTYLRWMETNNVRKLKEGELKCGKSSMLSLAGMHSVPIWKRVTNLLRLQKVMTKEQSGSDGRVYLILTPP